MFWTTLRIDDETYNKLASGEIVFRPGQWVQLDWCERKARYIGVTPHGTFVVQHYEGGYSKEKFKTLVEYWKGFYVDDRKSYLRENSLDR